MIILKFNHQVIINFDKDIWLKNSDGNLIKKNKGIYLSAIFDEPCDGYMFDLDRSGFDFLEYISDGSNLTLIENEHNRQIGIPEGVQTITIPYKYKIKDLVKIIFDKDYTNMTTGGLVIPKGEYIAKIDYLDIKNTLPITPVYGFYLKINKLGEFNYLSDGSNLTLINKIKKLCLQPSNSI